MNKYHDQKLIKSNAEAISSKSAIEKREIVKDLKDFADVAKQEYKAISAYTAPEEIERRQEALYYYKDLFEALGVKYDFT